MNNKPDNGWQEKLDDLIDSDYWSYPEDTRSMIFTTKKIKSFISSLLEQTREETIDSCIEALPKENNDMPDVAWRAGFNQALDQSLSSLRLLKNNKRR